MKMYGIFGCLLGITIFLAKPSFAAVYTDPETGIQFYTTTITGETQGGFTFGIALPPEAVSTNYYDYLGYIVGSTPNGEGVGWSGISHGGPMPNALLLMGWPYEDDVLTSFRFATGYVTPDLYTGNATLAPISYTVNATNWSLLYKCINCLQWNQNGNSASQSTTSGIVLLGWSQSLESPTNPETPDGATIVEHDNGEDIFVVPVVSATFSSYSAWATKTQTVTTSATATTTPTVSPTYSSKPVPTTTYDYVIVGAGAGGIPIADSLSAAGKSVLLIERGPPSSGRWGGTMKPEWLDGTNLTRFDVPGLCNQLWHDSLGIACADTPSMAGCVLGGGTAVNAGLWWKPNPIDWDYNFPTGWKSTDMAAATTSVFSRIPGTDTPSMDGKLYYQQGFQVVTTGLAAAGWTSLSPINNSPGSKNKTYGHTEYMYSGGERGGPMATMLVTASARSNFKMWTNTTVTRLRRSAGHITGIEVQAYGNGGYAGTVNVTATGRVILSAGVFGTSKILFRSGIGLSPELETVQKSTDGPTMVDENFWINLPVGENLNDHVNTDTVISHPNVTFYDFYAAWDTPIAADANAYLKNRTGILAQAAPNIGPMFWDEITGSDGITRQLEWTARVEGSEGAADGTTMTLSQYLGRGSTSRGKLSIQADLTTSLQTLPYLRTAGDVDAVVKGIQNVQTALSKVANLTYVFPTPGQTASDYVNNYAITVSGRTANHWIGTAKMGTDDGRVGGTAVVDTNTKVYGTDNLFVVDASIFPGMVSTNPSAYVVTASVKAASNILALALPSPAGAYEQCGGLEWSGTSICKTGYSCIFLNPYYYQCYPNS